MPFKAEFGAYPGEPEYRGRGYYDQPGEDQPGEDQPTKEKKGCGLKVFPYIIAAVAGVAGINLLAVHNEANKPDTVAPIEP